MLKIAANHAHGRITETVQKTTAAIRLQGGIRGAVERWLTNRALYERLLASVTAVQGAARGRLDRVWAKSSYLIEECESVGLLQRWIRAREAC